MNNNNNSNNSTQKSPWLDAWSDPVVTFNTRAACVKLGDVMGDGDSKLIIGDMSSKKIVCYQGVSIFQEEEVISQPVAMAIVCGDSKYGIPMLAVASGPYVFMYRQLRPFIKLTCPDVKITEEESNIWYNLSKNNNNNNDNDYSKSDNNNPMDDTLHTVESLKRIRLNGARITARSAELLSLDSLEQQHAFINQFKNIKLVQQTTITCLGVLNSSTDNDNKLSHLIIGTESKQLLIMPCKLPGNGPLCDVTIPGVPVMLNIQGGFESEWRISIACRDGKIYFVKSADRRGSAVVTGSVIDPGGMQIVALARQDKLLWVADMKRYVAGYTVRGKRVLGSKMPCDINDMQMVDVMRGRTSFMLLLALQNGEVRTYTKDLELIHTLFVEGPVIALQYGNYGREEGTLIVVHGRGALSMKILRRRVDLIASNNDDENQVADVPIPIPRKSKVFLEQSRIERDNAVAIRDLYQKDYIAMRLKCAKTFMQTLEDVTLTGGVSPSLPSAPVRIHVKVMGLGPLFTLQVLLINTATTPFRDLKLNFSYDTSIYAMGSTVDSNNSGSNGSNASAQAIIIPTLLPGPKHRIEARVKCVSETGAAGEILVLLAHGRSQGSNALIVSASVRMPPSELMV